MAKIVQGLKYRAQKEEVVLFKKSWTFTFFKLKIFNAATWI
jgi:hypothetical protein